jgi:hypothetical protein
MYRKMHAAPAWDYQFSNESLSLLPLISINGMTNSQDYFRRVVTELRNVSRTIAAIDSSVSMGTDWANTIMEPQYNPTSYPTPGLAYYNIPFYRFKGTRSSFYFSLVFFAALHKFIAAEMTSENFTPILKKFIQMSGRDVSSLEAMQEYYRELIAVGVTPMLQLAKAYQSQRIITVSEDMRMNANTNISNETLEHITLPHENYWFVEEYYMANFLANDFATVSLSRYQQAYATRFPDRNIIFSTSRRVVGHIQRIVDILDLPATVI